MLQEQIAFIGTGQMARALAQGLVQSGLVDGNRIRGVDPLPLAGRQFTEAVPKAVLASSHREAVLDADIVVLATKPQQLPQAAAEIKDCLTRQQLIVSIAAGVSLCRLTELFGSERIIRVMPNTPCLVGSGASAFALGPGATQADAEIVEQMLGAVGKAYRVQEHQLDAVTGLSGSGPAFVYLLIESLSDGGVRVGLPRDIATALAAQTVCGAAEMVLATGEHPAVLKDRVASPGGTTIAGLHALEQHGFRAAGIDAVVQAARRASEMRNE